jgi:RNA polymerase sigma-70 factor (ECF subfamily)
MEAMAHRGEDPAPEGAATATARSRQVTPEVRAAFVDLYTEQYRAIRAYLRRRTSDLATADDLTAEVFRVAWEHTADGVPSVGWLFVTARYLLANARRSAATVAKTQHRATSEASRQEFPGATRDAHDLPEDLRVLGALNALPESHREVLRLRYWEELGGAEAATALGCTPAAWWVRLHRARAAFADAYAAMEESS